MVRWISIFGGLLDHDKTLPRSENVDHVSLQTTQAVLAFRRIEWAFSESGVIFGGTRACSGWHPAYAGEMAKERQMQDLMVS